MIQIKLYHADSKEDALRALSKRPDWALRPVQITEVNGSWFVVRIEPSKILNQTLYICFCTLTMYLNKPDTFPGHWHELRSLFDTDPNLTGFAYKIAQEFDEKHQGLTGTEYQKALDDFIDQKIKELR